MTDLRGGLDGGGKVVRNLYINRPDENEVGLFGAVQKSGSGLSRRRHRLAKRGRRRGRSCGSDCGADIRPTFRIEDSWAQGRVVGREGVGGIVGRIDSDLLIDSGIVSLSWFAGDVVGDVAGGLAGEVVDEALRMRLSIVGRWRAFAARRRAVCSVPKI